MRWYDKGESSVGKTRRPIGSLASMLTSPEIIRLPLKNPGAYVEGLKEGIQKGTITPKEAEKLTIILMERNGLRSNYWQIQKFIGPFFEEYGIMLPATVVFK